MFFDAAKVTIYYRFYFERLQMKIEQFKNSIIQGL